MLKREKTQQRILLQAWKKSQPCELCLWGTPGDSLRTYPVEALLTTSKKTETLALHPKEQNSVATSFALGKESRTPDTIIALTKILIWALKTLRRRPSFAVPGCLTYRNRRMINGCCFKMQNLGWYVNRKWTHSYSLTPTKFYSCFLELFHFVYRTYRDVLEIMPYVDFIPSHRESKAVIWDMKVLRVETYPSNCKDLCQLTNVKS